MNLTKKEIATILAALRLWQKEIDAGNIPYRFSAHFDEEKPLTNKEIDDLCQRINFARTQDEGLET